MTATAHTPGPWKVVLHGKAAYVSMFIGKDGLPPSATGDAQFSVQPYIRPAEAEANARLIAAAPDLLEALKTARHQVSLFARPDDEIAQAVLQVVDAAIEKARKDLSTDAKFDALRAALA